MKEKLMLFFKNETVLAISLVLALCSMLVIPPDATYLTYIDWSDGCHGRLSDIGLI